MCVELYSEIRKISFLFFFILGLAHFLAGLFFINGYAMETSGLVNRILFIPFVLASITYVFANLKCHLMELGNTSKKWDYALLGIGIIIFLALLGIELFVIDSATPLQYSSANTLSLILPRQYSLVNTPSP